MFWWEEYVVAHPRKRIMCSTVHAVTKVTDRTISGDVPGRIPVYASATGFLFRLPTTVMPPASTSLLHQGAGQTKGTA